MRAAHLQADPFGKFKIGSSSALGMRATIVLNFVLDQFCFISHFDTPVRSVCIHIPIQDFQPKPG